MAATKPSVTIAALTLALASLGACSSKSTPRIRTWELTFDDASAPIGARVLIGEHVVGAIEAPASYDTGRKLPYVRGPIPPEVESIATAAVEVEVASPCGTTRIPVTMVPKEGRASPLLHLDTSKTMTTTLVWSALPSKTKFKIGEVEPRVNMGHFLVNSLDCAPRHSLTVDGAAVGELELTDEALVGVFVAKDSSTCYEVTVASFGRDGGATHKTILRGKPIYPFPHAQIDYRDKPVPEILSVSEGTVGVTKVGVSEIDCGAVPD
ncbi:hypothetical protein [Enhygromyxa salina]|uniref:Lipoprotein n=1 Tax=Enhygromyxa salina TaxID=215803 RepID=A0A2S9YUR7_9BACT|nr:hypothetical protein [Enhygromyxa salina]PRQ08838.1 hypothetical protein ENSA7_14700 [Enhygromyxa salina]